MATSTKKAKTKPKTAKPVKKPTKKKLPKEEGVRFTEGQFDIILDGFYEGMTNSILDLVFDSQKADGGLSEEMIDFIAQKIVNDLDFPTTDETLKAKVDEIMKDDGANMAQDLIFNQVRSVVESTMCEEECDNCKDSCKGNGKNKGKGKGSELNKKRGLA